MNPIKRIDNLMEKLSRSAKERDAEIMEELQEIKDILQPPVILVPPKRWRAETNKPYYILDQDGTITSIIETSHIADDYAYNTGNYAQTTIELELKQKQLLIQTAIEDYILELNDGWVWEEGEYYCYPHFSWKNQEFFVGSYRDLLLQNHKLYCKDRFSDQLESKFTFEELYLGLVGKEYGK